MSKQSVREKQFRQQIANYAAKLIYETGIRDYQMAKQKAASALGFSDAKCLPTNQELENALAAYIDLFDAVNQSEHLQKLRRIAIDAMQFFSKFNPRLVGSVLSGNAAKHDSIVLHLFCDFTEKVGLSLHDAGVPFEERQKRMHISQHEYAQLPVIRFIADNTSIELVIFAHDAIRQSPLSPIDNKPMQRASLSEVQALVSE